MDIKKERKISVILRITEIFYILLLAVAVAFLFLQKTNIKFSFVNKPTDLTEGWVMVNEDGSKTEFYSWGQEIEKTKIVLEHKLDFLSDTSNAIGISNYYSAVSVYVNESLIYSYGKLEDLENNILIGNLYSIVHLDSQNSGDTLKIVYENIDVQTVYSIEVGDQISLTENLFFSYSTVALMVVLAIIAFFVMICLKISKRTRKYVTSSYKFFYLFFATCAFWELMDSQFLMILGVPAGIVSFLSFEIYMLLPIALLQFVFQSSKLKGFRVLDMIMIFLVIINFLGLNGMYYFYGLKFINTLYTTHVCVATTLALCLIQTLVQWFKSVSKKPKNEELHKDLKFNRLLGIGMLIFACFSTIQFYEYFINPADSNTEYFRIGAIALVVIEVVNIIRRINDRVEEERNTNQVRMWDEKIKVEETRSIMIDAFKTIIPEDYIDDIINAYKSKNERDKKKGKNNVEADEDSNIINIGHSMKYATILVSDIRGFSEISSKLNASRLGEMLNHYLGSMTDIVEKYNGHVLEFMGDGILAGFGTVKEDDKHADEAVMAAIEMQKAMPEINKWNSKHGFPDKVEIGVGINTGYVFAGIIGSLGRFKYDVLGATVNLASRIESYTLGGQVLISEDTKATIRNNMGFIGQIKATPKGFDNEMTYYLINRIADMELEIEAYTTKPLENPIPVKFYLYEGKADIKKKMPGTITEVGENSIVMTTKVKLEVFETIKIEYKEGVTCKVASMTNDGYVLRFTSMAVHYNGASLFEDKKSDDDENSDLDSETRRILKEKKERYNFYD